MCDTPIAVAGQVLSMTKHPALPSFVCALKLVSGSLIASDVKPLLMTEDGSRPYDDSPGLSHDKTVPESPLLKLHGAHRIDSKQLCSLLSLAIHRDR